MFARYGTTDGGIVCPTPCRARNAIGTPAQSANTIGADGAPNGVSGNTVVAPESCAASNALPSPEPPIIPIRGERIFMSGYYAQPARHVQRPVRSTAFRLRSAQGALAHHPTSQRSVAQDKACLSQRARH